MKLIDAFAFALDSEYEINAVARGLVNDPKATWPVATPEAVILSDSGADFTPINGHPTVTGHELVRRLDLAHKRQKALKRAIENTTALLAARMKGNLDAPHDYIPSDTRLQRAEDGNRDA